MNDILKKKLASYSAFTASLLAANQFSGQAQIIYTNIPDTYGLQIFTGESIISHYDLDLNNDGIVDFKLDGYLLTYTPYGTVEASVWVTGTYNAVVKQYHVGRLDCGQSIGAQADFVSWGLLRLVTASSWFGSGESDSMGMWDDSAPHIMGLKLIVGGDTLYGWVRLKVINDGEFEIFDYAYNGIPNEEIIACDTSSFATSASVTNENESSITAFVSADNLTVQVSNNLLPNTLIVVNTLGEPIISKEITEEKNDINLSAFPAGIYLVTIGDGKSLWSRKVVLSR